MEATTLNVFLAYAFHEAMPEPIQQGCLTHPITMPDYSVSVVDGSVHGGMGSCN